MRMSLSERTDASCGVTGRGECRVVERLRGDGLGVDGLMVEDGFCS